MRLKEPVAKKYTFTLHKKKVSEMKVAVIGATGLVGTVMLRVLEERGFPVSELIPAASSKSVGKTVTFKGKEVKVVSVEEAIERKPAVALFSAGAETSKKYAPLFMEKGIYVVDNSSAWRMDQTKKLIVPEVNGSILEKGDLVIANPNCSTIQLVVVLGLIHKEYGIKRVVVSTYQSVTGTGVNAVKQLYDERAGRTPEMVYPHPIDLNCFPHGGSFLDSGYTTEEQKLIDETRKIIGDQSILVSPTVVRIPVVGGHSESVNVEMQKPYELVTLVKQLAAIPGVTIQDDPKNNIYPMPKYSEGKDDVFVGRIRRDPSVASGLNLWIVSDNLRKGAATNAVQIAELLQKKGWIA